MAKATIRKALKAKQVVILDHPEGGSMMLILATDGGIYLKSDTGWKAFDMTEDPDNDSTI